MTEWRAACMDDDEWALWQDANRRLNLSDQLERPCQECPLAFALEMRAVNRCNGEPSGAPEPDDLEEEPMSEANPAVRTIGVAVEGPCATCVHVEVCAIKADIDRIATSGVGVQIPETHKALTSRITFAFDCSQYLPVRKARKLNLTPEDVERRRRQAAMMTERAAAKRAAAKQAA